MTAFWQLFVSTALSVFLCFLALPASSGEHDNAATSLMEVLPPITNTATIGIGVEEMWAAWTTAPGADTWLAPATEIDGRPGGVYRAIYNPAATRVIDRGNDGRIISMEENKMLVLTWMTPLHMDELKGNSTVLLVYFHALGPTKTRVYITNFGYGQGPAWKKAYDYNVKGWDRILSALEYRFEHGPMDWDGRVEELKKTGKISYWREHKKKAAAKE